MSKFDENLERLALPSWMNVGEVAKLLVGAKKFWRNVAGRLQWPLQQIDPLTCDEKLLNLLAFDRDISRFNGEPLLLYRQRVNYAFINAKDAGSVAGFIAIFARLGVGKVELLERQPGEDWDVIIARLTDAQIADNSKLLMEIIRQYGRTCRRYRFEVRTSQKITVNQGWYGGEYQCYSASLPLHQEFKTCHKQP